MAFGDAYLTGPLPDENLPAEAWGSEALAIHLAGGSYRFSGLAPAQAAWARARFQAWCGPGSVNAAVVPIAVHRWPEAMFREIDTRGWVYTFDREYRPERLRLAGLGLVGEIRFAPGLQGRLWTCQTDSKRFRLTFENFFRVLVAYRTLSCGGVLLHSAAFARDGRAQVVMGRSGAGKSTSARLALSAGWEVLSDDMNALLPDRQGWRVEKLPFAGDLGQTPTRGRAYPVAGVHWLEQAPAHAVRPFSAATALARLLVCAPVVNEDPYRVDDVLRNLSDLVERVGVDALHFALDPGFLALLDAAGQPAARAARLRAGAG